MILRARHLGLLSILVLSGVGFAPLAHTQSCGDSDGNGSVTVTDGVNVLRHVASLSSACSNDATRCDLDGNGSVTVSDGVNVLRHVAGLSATLSCPGGANDVSRFAGRYQGTFSGDDRGDFDVDADCRGHIDGMGFSTVFDEDFDIFGTVTDDGDVTLTVGGTSSASTFRGTMDNDGRVSGTWRNTFEGTNGTFQGSRTGNRSCSAVYDRD
jgi:hypothetical protein